MADQAAADHAATVAAIYDAFGRGDVQAILAHLDDDVAWEQGIRDTGLGYLVPRQGKQQVADFFSALMANLVLTHFEPLGICAAGDLVTVPVRHAGSIVGGGDIPMMMEAHVWRFGANGKVIEFSHLLDCAIHELAAAKRSSHLQGRSLSVLSDTIRVDVAGGQLEIFELSGERDSGPPPHAHPWDEAYIGMEGEFEVTIGETTTVLRAGDVMRAPGGTLHSYRILSDRARFRVITSGHRSSLFFADLDANAPTGAPSPETLPAIIDVARRNGLSSPLFA